MCSPCSRAHFAPIATACVSSPREWAVSVGSHLQQDVDNSKAPPHPGALLPLFDPVHHRKPRYKKWRWFSLRHSCHLSVLQSVFSAPPGASCTMVLRKIIQITFVVLSIVISAAMVWPLRKRIYSRNSDLRIRKYYPSKQP